MKICDILVEVYLAITIMDQTEQEFYRAGAKGLPQPIISICAENYQSYEDAYYRGMKYHNRRLDLILKATAIAAVIVGMTCLLPMFWGNWPNPILVGIFIILFCALWISCVYMMGKFFRF
jgi:hypothetical protein